MKLFKYYKHVSDETVLFYPSRVGDFERDLTVYIGYWVDSTSKEILSHDILEVLDSEECQWIMQD